MKHSWTGGQYSVWRVLLGLGLILPLYAARPEWVWRLGATVLAFALIAGLRDRLAALLLAIVWWWGTRHVLLPSSPGVWTVCGLLLLHAATRGSPFGSLEALGRSDPGGNWILPRWNFAARRLLLVAAAVACVLRARFDIPWTTAVALVLACLDPAWVPPLREKAPTRVFYDGGCGLCHRFVRFALAEDLSGGSLRFAPLQGETYRAAFAESERAAHPDSVVVQTDAGDVLVRSRASLHVLARLGGMWRAIAGLLRVVPPALLDPIYDAIASVRLKLFARPTSACPIMPAHLTRRFDP